MGEESVGLGRVREGRCGVCWSGSVKSLLYLLQNSVIVIIRQEGRGDVDHIQLQMRKYLRVVGQGVKLAAYLGGATLAASAAYLYYINTQLGPIHIDREAMTKYYSEHSKEFNVTESEARNMYYWLLLDIALMRVLTYSSYSSSCARLNAKVLDRSLANYDQKGLTAAILAVNAHPDPKQERRIFNEVLNVRRANFENIENYEFAVKEVRKQQKLMDTRKVLGLDGERLQKLEAIHQFLCQHGEAYNHAEIKKYNQQVPALESLLPGDIVHKILVI